MLDVRDMQPHDLGPVSQLAEALVLLHHQWDRTRFFTTPDIATGYHRFFGSQLKEPSVLLLTALNDRIPVGYLYGTMEGRDWAKLLDAHGAIHDLYVDPSARRQRVGRLLMDTAKERFRQKGAKRLVLYSATHNAEGQALFRSLGYRPTMVELTLDVDGAKP